MDSLTRSLNFELPHDFHLNKYAQHVLENTSKASIQNISNNNNNNNNNNNANHINGAHAVSLVYASTPTISTFDVLSNNEFLQKFGASILNSIQLKQKLNTAEIMDPNYAPNRVIIDSSSFDGMDELQKQLEYDKFMNEVWIGIVFTLILISMIFCICSCFLYHQFRTWKQNYHNNEAQNSNQGVHDIESIKTHSDLDDPVPEYTLVSGLPSYEAALELLHKTPKSCLIVYPSVFNVFNKHEKANSNEQIMANAATTMQRQQQQQHHNCEATMPLLGAATAVAASTTPVQEANAMGIKSNYLPAPAYAEAMNTKCDYIDEKISATCLVSATMAANAEATATLAPTSDKSHSNLEILTHKSQK